MNDYFQQNIRFYFPPDKAGVVMALRAYVDGSVRSSNLICVAAISYGFSGAKKASAEWSKLFGDKVCHMTDLNAKKKDFKDISSQEASYYIVEAVKIINKHAKFIATASFDMNEISEYLPREAYRKHTKALLNGFATPYALACHSVMYAIAQNTTGNLSYVFEAGDEGQKAAKKFLEYLRFDNYGSPILDFYRLGSVVYDSKDGSHVLLQSADILAWEWAKNIDRIRSGKKVRKSLDAILEGTPIIRLTSGGYLARGKEVEACHFSGEGFTNILKQMSHLLSAKTVDEVNAVRANSDMVLSQS